MTSPDQLGQQSEEANAPSEEAPEPPLDPQQRPAGRFSLSGNKRGLFWITLSLVALAGLSIAVIDVASGGTHQPTSSGAPAASGAAPATTSGSSIGAQVPAGTSTAKNKVTSAAQLAAGGGALTVPKGMQSILVSWQSGPGGKDLAAVSSRFGDALQSAAMRQYSAMRYACAQLVGSVATAEAGPQIPDAAMQKLYAKALAELAKGATHCQTAISSKPNGDETLETNVDQAQLRLSVSELAAGAKDIFRSTAEIEIASRQHH